MSDGAMITLPVLPLRDIVVFPHMIVPLFVGREKSISALEAVMAEDKQIILVTQREADTEDPDADGLYTIGTVGSILQLLKLPDGAVKVLVEGGERVRIDPQTLHSDHGFLAVDAEILDQTGHQGADTDGLARATVQQFDQYIKFNKKVASEVLNAIEQVSESDKIADMIASHLAVKIEEKQELLEFLDVHQRLERIFQLMENEIGALQVEKRVRNRVKRQMEKTQREYYLNEQMKAIQKELGDGEDGRGELEELEEALADTKMPKAAREKADAELRKLKNMGPMSAEATVVRNYLDWILAIPWQKASRLKKDIGKAREILDADHYGLEKVKDRIIEFLAVQQRTKSVKGPILCLVGPPGVGKTSLGKSIARATGPQICPHGARRRARRGRDQGASAYLYRIHARQDRAEHEEGGDQQSAVPSGRGRQAWRRLARRPQLGASRGARSGAEQHLPGPLHGAGSSICPTCCSSPRPTR